MHLVQGEGWKVKEGSQADLLFGASADLIAKDIVADWYLSTAAGSISDSCQAKTC